MNILHVIPYVFGERSGPANVCCNISRYLNRKNHKVTILTTDYRIDKDYCKMIENEGIKFVIIPGVFNIGLFVYSPSMNEWLKDNIKNYDIVHLHEFQSHQNNLAYHYSRKYGIPFIMQAHGLGPKTIHGSSILKSLYNELYGYKIVREATKVIALSNIEKQEYKAIGVDSQKIKIIPNGIDFYQYQNQITQGSFRDKYSINPEEKIILFLGRLNVIKGLDFLIESFELLSKELDHAKLVLVGGDDGYLSTIKRKIDSLSISEKVIITGPLFGKEKAEAYADADILVYPSSYEVFGLVPFEAMLFNTPVIVTEGSGGGEIIETINGGFVVKYGDRLGLNNRIKFIINNPTIADEIAMRGRKFVETELNYSNIVNRYEMLYEGCLD